MIPHPTQNIVIESNARFRVLCCGRRWGKTTLAVEEMKCAYATPSRVAYIAPTYQQARDIAWEALRKEFLGITSSVNESRLELKVKCKDGGESTIILRGWESIETLRGQAFDFIVIDEIASMRNFWLSWEEVIRPTLTDRKGKALFISTPKGFNHFYDLFNTQDEDYKSFHYTTYDNPFIDKEEIEKAKKELPSDRFAQEYMADFRKSEGLVYKEFNRDFHLFDTEVVREGKNYVAGIDFGFTNPCAVLHCLIDKDANYWITEEWYKTGRTEEQIGDYVKSCGFNGVCPDPESPSAIEVLNSKGISVIEVIKGKDSIKSGIDAVRAMFKTSRLHIHKSCVNLIQELETYSYPEKTGNHNEPENPIKENDHALDSLRYLISSTLKMSRQSDAQVRQSQQFQTRKANFTANSTK
jgi:PBSX family phage terminase large subunit